MGSLSLLLKGFCVRTPLSAVYLLSTVDPRGKMPKPDLLNNLYLKKWPNGALL